MPVMPLPVPDRADAARTALAAKRVAGLTWAEIATALDRSPAWATAAVLGQHTLSTEQASALGSLLDLDGETVRALQLPPERGVGQVDLTDPVVYRLHEMVQVYGTTIRELILEEFGDGIMSAIDFELHLTRVPDPRGDRVRLVLDGKFLPYREF